MKASRNPLRGFSHKLHSMKRSTQVYGRKVARLYNDIEKYIDREMGRGRIEARQVTKLQRARDKLRVIYDHTLSLYHLLK